MLSPLEIALAAEVLDEAHRRRMTHKHLQEVTGIPSRTWRNYFGSRNAGPRNSVPAGELFKVADALGVYADDLIRRARERVAAEDPGLPADPYALAAKRRPRTKR